MQVIDTWARGTVGTALQLEIRNTYKTDFIIRNL